MVKLTQEQIRQKVDAWAKLCGQIATTERARNLELHPHQVSYEKKTRPITEKWNSKLDPLQEKADALETEIVEWLEAQKKSVRIEGKKAVAEFTKSRGFGDRVVDAEKFVARCIERNIKHFWQKYVTVTIKNAQLVMGKEDMDELCSKPPITMAAATLELKD